MKKIYLDWNIINHLEEDHDLFEFILQNQLHFVFVYSPAHFSDLMKSYIETFLCQVLPIWVLRKLIKRPRYNLIPCILVSAIIFGVQHTYSWQYMVGTFIFGIPMAALYYLCRYRRENAFIVVFAYHGLWNAFGFLLD